MRLFDDRRTRLLVGLTAASALAMLGGCSAIGGGPGPVAKSAVAAKNGPQADYPVLVGEPYTIDGITFTPNDVLNYDEVGYLAAADDLTGITAAHHTLPVPSYIEVTSLDTGRTILARVEQRGPMTSTRLLALSPAAMSQLGAGADLPVRVRRVNPPEEQRAELRAGGEAPLRMDTPMSLVAVLKRQLPAAPATLASVEAAPEAVQPEPEPASEYVNTAVAQSEPETPAAAPAPPATGVFLVQVAAFANPDNAERAAQALDGTVSQSGRYYSVRTGPFTSRAEAEGSLAKVRAAGYSDARIFTND
ncbi:SPOR domain-containing protein [Aurantiacibacter suaedae]|uniref:SPOR domain-containing protein n=1 Tax=Aurantiacibacter suaedae TaxID=2545755 RepID=UPI001F4F4875|nr:SPOR domain-containing protein [Aurantiacibacter suaedae]